MPAAHIPRSAGQRFAPSGQDQRRQTKPVPLEFSPALRSNERTSPLLRNAITGDQYIAKTAAQRQALYRARRPHAGEDGNGERRLNLWVSTRTDLAIERLARRYCVTKREIVERLVTTMDDRIIATLDIDAPEWDQYFTAASVTQ